MIFSKGVRKIKRHRSQHYSQPFVLLLLLLQVLHYQLGNLLLRKRPQSN